MREQHHFRSFLSFVLLPDRRPCLLQVSIILVALFASRGPPTPNSFVDCATAPTPAPTPPPPPSPLQTATCAVAGEPTWHTLQGYLVFPGSVLSSAPDLTMKECQELRFANCN